MSKPGNSKSSGTERKTLCVADLESFPEREAIERLGRDANLEAFLTEHGANMSVLGAKNLLCHFDKDFIRLIDAALKGPASEALIGVLLANLPRKLRTTPQAERLLAERIHRRRLVLQERHREHAYLLKTDVLEEALGWATDTKFIENVNATLEVRESKWRDWCERIKMVVTWVDLWTTVREQPKYGPPSSGFDDPTAILTETVGRLRASSDMRKVKLGRVLEQGGQGSIAPVLLCLGFSDPLRVRRLGIELHGAARQDLHALRERTLEDVAAILALKYPRLWPDELNQKAANSMTSLKREE
jgi:hypothetical protein